MHVDLDGATEIYAAHGWRLSDTDDLFTSGMTRMLELFGDHGIRATLFVIANSLRDARKRALLVEAVRQGHEIASHTVTHRDLLTLDRAQKFNELWVSKDLLEQELGVEVLGFRAPGYRIDREAVEVLEECGYGYDSSAFPTRVSAERLDAPVSSLIFPGRPFQGLSLRELPLPDHRPSPFPFSPSYSLLFGIRFFRWGIHRARRTGGPMVLLFHLTDLAEPLSRDQLVGWRSNIFTLSCLSADAKLRRCEAMLDFVGSHFSFVASNELIGDLDGR